MPPLLARTSRNKKTFRGSIPLNLLNKTFGRLLVVRKSKRKTGIGGIYWYCKCTCGKYAAVSRHNLQSGTAKSCGCLRLEPKKHGMLTGINGKKPKVYCAWTGMKKRCRNKIGHKNYPYYLGRGIRYCIRWEKFENFLSDMGMPPTKKHSLDRIDNNKGYNKKNCRWATQTEQMRNTTRTRRITFNNKTLSMAE